MLVGGGDWVMVMDTDLASENGITDGQRTGVLVNAKMQLRGGWVVRSQGRERGRGTGVGRRQNRRQADA